MSEVRSTDRVSQLDAPRYYDNKEASAWACGYNAAVDLAIERLSEARSLMRDLWRLEGVASDELASKVKTFIGGG